MHIFKYSVRKGTKAEKMEMQINPEKKEERSSKLIELSDKNEKDYLKEYIGKTLLVLFEEKQGEFYKGHTSNYIEVKTKSEKDIQNEILNVKIEKQEGLELYGITIS